MSLFLFSLFLYSAANACMPTENSRNPILSTTTPYPNEESSTTHWTTSSATQASTTTPTQNTTTTTIVESTTTRCCSIPLASSGPDNFYNCTQYHATCSNVYQNNVGLYYSNESVANFVTDANNVIDSTSRTTTFILYCNTTDYYWDITYDGQSYHFQSIKCAYRNNDGEYI